MRPIAWLTGASVTSWLAVTAIAGDRLNPEALYGMLAPLAGTCVSWWSVARTFRSAPERVMGVMIVGFAIKLMFFALYVALMLRLMALRPVPFVAVFVTYFIVLNAMQALFLKRLIAL
jgi:F0F1-type ATP synthase assembly protein I